MLNKLIINDYKCLTGCSLELKPLNLFAGPNSSGKSTALQALLIASDNITEKKGKHGLKDRRGKALNFNDVRNFITNAKSYQINISSNEEELVKLSFTPGDDLFQSTEVEQLEDAPANLLKLLKVEICYTYQPHVLVANIYIPLIPIQKTNWEVMVNMLLIIMLSIVWTHWKTLYF